VTEATGLAGATYLLPFAGMLSSFNGNQSVTPHALDPSDAEITGLQLEYLSLDPAIAQVSRWGGGVTLLRAGQVRIVVRTNAYGTLKADTATFTITPPAGQDVKIQAAQTLTGPGPLSFFPTEVKIRTFGVVVWNTVQGEAIDVTFDEPAKVTVAPSAVCVVIAQFSFLGYFTTETPMCGTGNVLVPGLPTQENGLPIGAFAIRQFTESGTYTYHSTRTGATGRIIVSDAP
jgi:hypothetical protein